MSHTTVLAVIDGLKLIESTVKESGGPFLTRKNFGAVDLLVWPFLECFRMSVVMLPGTELSFFHVLIFSLLMCV